MLRGFLLFDRMVQTVIGILASFALALSATLGLLQVASRFFFKFPFEWTEVTIRIALSWMVFVGVALVFRSGSMIAVDLSRNLFPARLRRLHDIFITLTTLGFLGWLGYWGILYANRGTMQTIIGIDFMTMYWAYISIPVGCLCSAIAVIARFLEPRLEIQQEQATLAH